MATCFVIQPFDRGRYDQRFKDTFRPAVEATGLDAYRVDEDPATGVLVESIEDGIRSARLCFAEISTDNPNVWYELGFAFACGKEVVMVCCDHERAGPFPFDIRHRAVLTYKSQSASDFTTIAAAVTTRIRALLAKEDSITSVTSSSPIASPDGLDPADLVALASIAGNIFGDGDHAAAWTVQKDLEKAGFTRLASSLALRRLRKTGLVESRVWTDEAGESYTGLVLSDRGWDWMLEHQAEFKLREPSKPAAKKPAPNFDDTDDIPF